MCDLVVLIEICAGDVGSKDACRYRVAMLDALLADIV